MYELNLYRSDLTGKTGNITVLPSHLFSARLGFTSSKGALIADNIQSLDARNEF